MIYPGVTDLQELSRETLSRFDRRVAALPAELSAPFHEEARQLETELVGIYRFVALCTRSEEDLEGVARWWGFMVQVCDEFAGRLGELARRHSQSGADSYYDRVLDLRNKCRRLEQMHA